MYAIDTHAHIFPAREKFIANARYHPDYTVNAQDFIKQLDMHCFYGGVLVQPSFLGTDNSNMLAAIRQYPARLKGIAVIAPESGEAELRALAGQGIVGIRLNLFGKPCPDLQDAVYANLLKILAKLNWQLELHAPPAYLVQLLPQLAGSGITVVIDHFGRIDPKKGIADLDYQKFLQLIDPKQHWIKVSGFYRLAPENGATVAKEAFKLLLAKGMQERMIWGSDWPHTQNEKTVNYRLSINTLYEIVGDKALTGQILTTNAAALFGFQDTAPPATVRPDRNSGYLIKNHHPKRFLSFVYTARSASE